MGDYYYLLQAYKNAPAFAYFDLLPPEIRLMVFDYLDKCFVYRIRLATVSKRWRELIVRATRVSLLKLSEVNALPEEGYTNKRINPRWIGGQFSVTALKLDSVARFTVNHAHELIDTMSNLTTVIDPQNMLFMRPKNPRIMPHIKYYCCQEMRGGITNMVKALPNLEILSINLLVGFPTTNLKLTKLRTIYISERRPPTQHLPTLITRLKAIAPYLRTLLVTPRDDNEVKSIANDRKNAMRLHLIVNLFGPVLKEPKIFAEQFEANKRPYNFYRSGDCTLFRRAVEHKHFDTAKYMLENGLTTVKDEMGSYKLFPSTLDKCANIKPHHSEARYQHPFILDSSFTDESFMAYMISKGLNINAMVDGKTFFESYNIWNSCCPMMQYVLTQADIDFNVRTLEGQNPFHVMAKEFALAIFKLAIKRIENKPELINALYQCDHNGSTPLHMIFGERYNGDMINCVLKLNIDLTVKNSGGVSLSALINTLSSPRDLDVPRKLISHDYPIEDEWIIRILKKNNSADRLIEDLTLLKSKGVDFNKHIKGEPLISYLSIVEQKVLDALEHHGCNIHATFRGNKTLLFNAVCVWNGTSDSLQQFITKYKFDVNHMDDNGSTPLLQVLEAQLPESATLTVVKTLLEAGANPNIVARGGKHALQLAKKDRQLVNLLLDHGADINQRVDFEELCAMSTPLMDAVSSAQSYLFGTLMKKGDVHAKDDQGNTLLHIAHDYGKELCDELPDRVNAQNDHGETPLFTHYKQNNSVLCSLLDHGADITHITKAGFTLLHHALLTGNGPLIQMLLKVKELDLSVLDNMGRSAGHLIDSDNNVELLHKLFLTKSEEEKQKIIMAFNNVDCFGMTAVHYALETLSPTEFGKFIQNFKLDLHPETPVPLLNVAISKIPKKSIDYARQLIKLGASVTKADQAGNTPLHILCGKYPEGDHIISLVLRKGASITVKNNRGFSPIDMLPTIEAYKKPKFYVVSDRSRVVPSYWDINRASPKNFLF